MSLVIHDRMGAQAEGQTDRQTDGQVPTIKESYEKYFAEQAIHAIEINVWYEYGNIASIYHYY